MTEYKNTMPNPHTNPPIGTIIFPSRNDAETALEVIIDQADLFNRACLYSFYYACGIVPDESAKSIGWTIKDIAKAKVGAMRHLGYTEYYIDITTPHEIEPISDKFL